MSITIIPIKRIGADDGFRASALIVAYPITATTIDGPMIAADMTRKSVAKANGYFSRRLRLFCFFHQDQALIFVKPDDPLLDGDRLLVVDDNIPLLQDAHQMRMKTQQFILRVVAIQENAIDGIIEQHPSGADHF